MVIIIGGSILIDIILLSAIANIGRHWYWRNPIHGIIGIIGTLKP